MKSTGHNVTAEHRGDHIHIKGDATKAYQTFSPEVTRVEREFYFVQNSKFVIVDSIDADDPVSIDWLLHANAVNELGSNSFRYTGERAGFYGQVLYSEAGNPTLSQQAGFERVDPAEFAGKPESTCLTARYPATKRHRFATLLVPYPNKCPKSRIQFPGRSGIWLRSKLHRRRPETRQGPMASKLFRMKELNL